MIRSIHKLSKQRNWGIVGAGMLLLRASSLSKLQEHDPRKDDDDSQDPEEY